MEIPVQIAVVCKICGKNVETVLEKDPLKMLIVPCRTCLQFVANKERKHKEKIEESLNKYKEEVQALQSEIINMQPTAIERLHKQYEFGYVDPRVEVKSK